MSGILLGQDARMRLAWHLRAQLKPDEIDIQTWIDLKSGNLACLPFTTMGFLCDCYSYQLITRLLNWPVEVPA